MHSYPANVGPAFSSDSLRRRSGWAAGQFSLLVAGVAFLVAVTFSGCAANLSSNLMPTGAQGVSQASVDSAHDVTLNWRPSASSEVVGYNVYRGTGPGGPYAKLNSVPVAAMNYNDSTVQSGQTYYYVVTSINSNDLESSYSNEVTAGIP